MEIIKHYSGFSNMRGQEDILTRMQDRIDCQTENNKVVFIETNEKRSVIRPFFIIFRTERLLVQSFISNITTKFIKLYRYSYGWNPLVSLMFTAGFMKYRILHVGSIPLIMESVSLYAIGDSSMVLGQTLVVYIPFIAT